MIADRHKRPTRASITCVAEAATSGQQRSTRATNPLQYAVQDRSPEVVIARERNYTDWGQTTATFWGLTIPKIPLTSHEAVWL